MCSIRCVQVVEVVVDTDILLEAQSVVDLMHDDAHLLLTTPPLDKSDE